MSSHHTDAGAGAGLTIGAQVLVQFSGGRTVQGSLISVWFNAAGEPWALRLRPATSTPMMVPLGNVDWYREILKEV